MTLGNPCTWQIFKNSKISISKPKLASTKRRTLKQNVEKGVHIHIDEDITEQILFHELTVFYEIITYEICHFSQVDHAVYIISTFNKSQSPILP